MDLKTLPQKIQRIDVHTPVGLTGVLAFEDGRYSFSYQGRGEMVSLTMPHRVRSYASGRVPAIFEMNLPEGFVRETLHERLRRYTKVNDMLLLALQREQGIGRLSYLSSLNLATPPPDKLDALIHWDAKESAFSYLLNKYLFNSPISGVQPKVMVNSERGALVQPDLIIKTGDAEYPHLALNEFVCMSIAKACGLPVPQFWLSDNEELFIMERFDIEGDRRLGMEDFAVLMGKSNEHKYLSSYEQVMAALKNNTGNALQQVEQMFSYIAISCLLGNGDAHLKNFAVLYDSVEAIDSVRLSPLYDVVNTTVYPSDDRQLALKMAKTKEYPNFNTLCAFGKKSGIRKPERLLERLAQNATDYLTHFARWENFPELQTALEKSISATMVQKSAGYGFQVKRHKKRKIDGLDA